MALVGQYGDADVLPVGGTTAVDADGSGTCCNSTCGCSGDRHQCLPRCVVEGCGGNTHVVNGRGIGGSTCSSTCSSAVDRQYSAPDASVERAARQLTLEESPAGTTSSDAPAEAAPLTGDIAAPDGSVERVARKLTLEAGPSSEICGGRGASTHPFDPGTVFPLEFRYYKGNWLQHGSSSSSKSNSSSSSSSSSNDNTSDHDSWWDATCVGALLRPFDPGKRCRRSARIGKAVLGLDLIFDRGRAWQRMQHGG